MEISSDIDTIYVANSQNDNNLDSIEISTCTNIIDNISLSHLRACFEDIVKGNKVVFNLQTLEYIIMDLKINLKELESTLQQIIPYMLVSYIKSWPGWSRSEDYKNGSLKIDEYYEKFQKYVTFKLTYLIQKGFEKAKLELRNDSQANEIDPCSQMCVETQCQPDDLMGIKSFSAFSIDIEGPPKLLNTILFQAQDDDVILKMHGINGWTESLSIQQLVNWPFVEIEFISPFLKFSRKIIPHYTRYLAKTDDVRNCAKQEFIENVRVDPEVSRSTYSKEFLRKYIIAYTKYLKSKNIGVNKIIEISTIFLEFIRDIEELGSVCPNGICDSTTISFNMGGCRYMRNKKTAGASNSDNPDAPTIAYSEVITPKCSIQLFKNQYAEQSKDVDDRKKTPVDTYFKCIQQLGEKHIHDLYTRPSIMYSCFYCKKEYGGPYAVDAILNHFQQDHCMEHAIMCCECKKLYNTGQLVKNRWFHTCELNPTAKNPTINISFD